MSNIFNGTLSVSVQGTLSTNLTIGNVSDVINWNAQNILTSGSGLNQANEVFAATQTIAASSSTNLNLYGGLTDALGQTVNFLTLKGIFLQAYASNTNNVIVGGSSGTLVGLFGAITQTVVIHPGGMFAWTAPTSGGITVTPSTGNILELQNSSSGSSVTYDIILVGTM